eukprot:scpid23425/ scgid0896/ 
MCMSVDAHIFLNVRHVYSAEDRTRTNSLVAVYKHCNEQIYHYHLPDKPQTVALNGSTSSQLAQVCSCDFIEIFPSGIAKAWHIATSEWLVCVTKDQTIGLRDLKDDRWIRR